MSQNVASTSMLPVRYLQYWHILHYIVYCSSSV